MTTEQQPPQAPRARSITTNGLAHHRMQRYDEALTDFNDAVELDPADAAALASRAETYRVTKRHDEALADLNRAIEVDPANTWAIACRLHTHLRMKRYAKALADGKRYLSLCSTAAFPQSKPAT